jgi:hypothetical protein
MGVIANFVARWRRMVLRPRCVVYTCLFGQSEAFNDFVYERSGDIDFI